MLVCQWTNANKNVTFSQNVVVFAAVSTAAASLNSDIQYSLARSLAEWQIRISALRIMYHVDIHQKVQLIFSVSQMRVDSRGCSVCRVFSMYYCK